MSLPMMLNRESQTVKSEPVWWLMAKRMSVNWSAPNEMSWVPIVSVDRK
jgi:hypothetical protein